MEREELRAIQAKATSLGIAVESGTVRAEGDLEASEEELAALPSSKQSA